MSSRSRTDPTSPRALAARAGRPSRPSARERGVASVLSMMFLILFGSLATAMAIASRGNIRTAATHLHVMRAQSAAETGLLIATQRLQEAAARFVVSNSTIDTTYGDKFWSGDLSGTGSYTVLSAPSGFAEGSTPGGLAQALANRHAADTGVMNGVSVDAPTIANAPSWGSSSEYQSSNWLFTPAVKLETVPNGQSGLPLVYSVTYAPLANGIDVRVISTGYDFNYAHGNQPITRTVMEDFRMAKKVRQAIISPSKIMIGKGVHISGDLGARFTDVTRDKGQPMVMKSDFFGIDADLDKRLTDLFNSLVASDVDGDNRLRVGHPIEGAGMPLDKDYNGDGTPDHAFEDVTGDGYVDELDVFIGFYDKNHDHKVALSAALTAGTPAQGATPEFVDSGGNPVDDDLALLIDSSTPDRNKNGLWGFVDTNHNGRWDAGEAMIDYDAASSVNRDQVLGYRDGFIDKKDKYAKVNGKLLFKTTESAWSAAQGDPATSLRGPIRASAGSSPTTFGVSDNDLPNLTASTFDDANTALKADANGTAFNQQVADQLGISVSQLATYVENKSAGTSSPRYLRVDADANLDGLPDNKDTAYWEKMPFGSPSYVDVYFRPVYENMVFRDVHIPAGDNGLYKNCTFVGVTYIGTNTGNTHVLWGEYGKLTIDSATGKPKPVVTRIIYGDDAGETKYPTMLPSTAIPPDAMVLMAQPEMDKADVPSDQTGRPGYNLMPDPLVISGKRVSDTKRFSNNIRFHDCLFVGSIVSDKPTGYTQARNKLQFTGATRFTQTHPDAPDDPQLNPQTADVEDISKSSMMVPNYSVDIGTFNSPPSQNVQLTGAIVAGVMDVRGNTTLDGALLLTFSPVYGVAPMVDALGNPVGNPANYNTSIGYFGPADGDQESLDPLTLPIVGGQRIVGWDTDGDGLADVAPDKAQPAGSTAVPFYGFGRIDLRFNPNMRLPNGLMLPMRVDPMPETYREGNP